MPVPFSPTNVLPGFAGKLFDASSGEFLAEVRTFHASGNITNSDYQPAGDSQTYAIMQSHHDTLTFTETIFRDTKFLATVATALAANKQPQFNFQGTLTRPDGSVGRYVFYNVVPDGNYDYFNVSPGTILERTWSWRVNGKSQIQNQMGT